MVALKYLFVVMTCLTCLKCEKLKATDTSQTIETPGYSYMVPYSSNMYQTWSIETEDTSSSTVVEVEIDMEIQYCCCSRCYCDSLSILDGSNMGDTLLGKFCGTSNGNILTSSGRNMYMIFQSNSNTEQRGFKLSYKQVKGNDATWMIVGIVLAVLITILGVCFILFRCGVCKSKNQVSSVRLHQEQPQQPVWMTPRPQNNIQAVPVQYVQQPMYQVAGFQNPQAMEMQVMNQGYLPGTADNTKH